MGAAKVAATPHYVCWSQSCSIIPQPFVPSSQTVSTWKKRSQSEGSIACRYGQGHERSPLFGPATSSSGLYRSLSCDEFPKSGTQSLRRACSAGFFDEASASSWDEPSQHIIREYALPFQIFHDVNTAGSGSTSVPDSRDANKRIGFARQGQRPFPCFAHDDSEEPGWAGRDEIIAASIERKANSVDLPLSLRIIKRKRKWRRGYVEAGDTACCAVKKAFSSTVFIVRELQCYTLRMREAAFVYEDLQAILVRVQAEMHASFVWLFQQLFSSTPTLMLYVMILLANFTVHSMATDAAIAATPPPQGFAVTAEAASIIETHDRRTHFEFDDSSSATKAFLKVTPSSSSGNGGGGGANVRLVSGDGEDESVSGQVIREEELRLWDLMVEEAKKMGALDRDTAQGLVSPVTARMEPDGNGDHLRTELLYQTALAQDPDNALLLTNFAQFLHLVVQDYDRAEVYFKRAVGADSADAEAHSKYATFLWTVKKDLWAAEESFLEAISADPENSRHAAAYAHFLWSTGAEDTCFPLDSPDCDSHDLA